MMKKSLFAFLFCSCWALAGCASAPTNSSNTSTNSPANVPAEFSTKPVQPDGSSTPGIPPANQANLSNMPKGATPTPGIQDPSTIGRTPVPKGATPTPGIPSEEELKRQMSRPVDPNEVNRPAANGGKVDRAQQPPLKKGTN